MKNPILKSGSRVPDLWEVRQYMQKHNLSFPATIPVSFKDGKRKKMKSIRIEGIESYPCESCGQHTYLSYSIGGKSYSKEGF